MRLGDVTIERIVEYEGPFRTAQDMFPTLAADRLDAHRDWLRSIDALDADDSILLAVQSFLVRTPHHTILIDSCIGNDKHLPRHPTWAGKSDARFMDALAAARVGVEQIDYVLCTHLHVDHVGWNTRLEDGRWVPTFPNARYVFEATELAYWQAENAKEEHPVIAQSVLPIVEAGRAETVSNDHAIGDHIRLLATPGHTPGHVSIRIGRADEALVSGDVLHSPLQLRHPELSPRFDLDGALAARTRVAFLERCAETDTLCCMTHFPSPSFGRVSRDGSAFRCDPVGG